MSYKITLIPGDGIGPEVTEATQLCLDALELNIDWDIKPAGECALKKHGALLPDETLDSIRKNRIALKGPISTPIGTGFRSVNVELRKRLDLFCCLRPTKYMGAINSITKNSDIIVFRENTEDLYAGVEFDIGDNTVSYLKNLAEKNGIKGVIREDSAISIKTISEYASRRIIKFAFDYALANNRKKVTCVHKANILKYTDGLFLRVFKEVAQNYQSKIEANDYIVDNLSMQLVLRPENFDILVLPNLYGDIISDLCSGLVGGLGIAAGANIGDNMAVFEPVHGSAPKYAGLNKVNPTATILSAVLMLHYIKEHKAADLLEQSVKEIITEGVNVTYDLMPKQFKDNGVSTIDMAKAICNRIKEKK